MGALNYMFGITKDLKGLLGTRWGLIIHQMATSGHKDVLYKTMLKTIGSIKKKLRELNIYGTAKCELKHIPANTPKRPTW